MKKQFFIVLLSLVPLFAAAQSRNALDFNNPIVIDENYVQHKVTRTVGIYITDLYNLNSEDEIFSVELRVWGFGPKESEASYLEFNHAIESDFTGLQVVQRRDSVWGQVHASLTYNFDWDMTHFPFDVQTLRIECENSIDRDFVELVGDVKNSGVADNAIQKGFVVDDVRFFNDVQHTTSNFGNPLMGPKDRCDFSCYVAEIDIRRENPWMLFLKIFSAVIVSFFIATITFLVNPHHFDARLSLTVGSLFAAVGSKFIVDSLVGISNDLMLTDRIYILTYVMIFFIAVLQLISYKMYRVATDRQLDLRRHRYFDLAAFCIINVVYIVCISWMVAMA